jgi:anthranilate/para-aminobenzoate synthase component I
MIPRSRTLDLSASWSSAALTELGRGPAGERLLLEGSAHDDHGWRLNGLIALQPRCLMRLDARDPAAISTALRRIDDERSARQCVDSDGSTGLGILLSYEALAPGPGEPLEPFPAVLVLAVDRSIRHRGDARWRLTVREKTDEDAQRTLDFWSGKLLGEPLNLATRSRARIVSAPQTSLPRPQYLEAVQRLQRWIAEGQLYQANLCQRFTAAWRGDPLVFHARLAAACPAPRSAYVSIGHAGVSSVSPETFVRVEAGAIETLPIKGTRARDADPEADRRAVEDLLSSSKDRAELLMIVDLERNDLGRLCRPGSVSVPELATPRSYATVHHLVATVRGELRSEVGWTEMVRAMFPGGSITGAPKESAMQRLRRLEPVPRGPFTGSLFWCGDDGAIDSSILIRTAVFTDDAVCVGAGGGIVADSDPLSEWEESNHTARALTETLGFAPEEAG